RLTPPPCVRLTGPLANRAPLHHALVSVHRHRLLTCPSVPAVTICSSSTAHLPTSARFRAQAPGPVSSQLDSTPGGRTGHDDAGFLLPFGRRRSLLGHPVPPGASAPLAIGLPRRKRRGPGRGSHVPHA